MLRLRYLRRGKGWTLEDLSKRTGISVPDLSCLERGLCPTYPGWQRRISKTFQLPIAVIFEDIELPEDFQVSTEEAPDER